jgi:hypothetical protein
MLKFFPNTGYKKASEILQYKVSETVILMCGISFIGYLLLSFGRRFFGIISYNVTYEIRKKLYETILVKNIGYFDFPENSTPVLSGIMQSDTTIINGVATDSIPP